MGRWKREEGSLTCYYLNPLDERPAEVHDVGGRRRQRPSFKPEHLVDTMMLSTAVRQGA